MDRNLGIRMILTFAILAAMSQSLSAQVTGEKVRNSIRAAQQFLMTQQATDGSWSIKSQHRIGATSLAVLGFLNSGKKVDDFEVQKGLTYLRSIPSEKWESGLGRFVTYELSLMTMALAAANEKKDRAALSRLVSLLERGQVKRGPNVGGWYYGLSENEMSYDNSNTQYAVLALREAAHYGIPVSRETWTRARRHWIDSQNADGGWGYSDFGGGGGATSTGSMTVAGIASMVIIDTMLGDDSDEIDCCGASDPNTPLERGIKWMARNFAVGANPNATSNTLYYLYGLERAGRLSGRRYFGEKNDWYRRGADYLTRAQRRDGSWTGDGLFEEDPVLSTSFSLLFLSKGMAPAVIGKLKFGGVDADKIPDDLWNRHPRDVHHLMEFVSGRDDWPKLLTWQVVELPKLEEQTAQSVLSQTPILYLTSDQAPLLTENDVRRIRLYLDSGGTLFATAGCESADFDQGFRALVDRLYPDAKGLFRKLETDHPVYRSEFLLPTDSIELWGIDFGCRTPIIYTPQDPGCYWDHWSKIEPPGRKAETKLKIDRMMQLGTNVVAYVTGREPADKLVSEELALADSGRDDIERGFLQIAKLRHEGGWDTAPMALRNLLHALNEQTGGVSRTKKDFVASDKNILNYPLLYMHGRTAFEWGETERKQLREYLQNGGVLFADACCGAPQFDQSFREQVKKLFPELTLERIPIEHEIFRTPFDIREVTRRLPGANGSGEPLKISAQKGQPILEGITIDGQLAIIYSRYDLSCALEKQASLVCNGYASEDALNIAMNIVIYSMME